MKKISSQIRIRAAFNRLTMKRPGFAFFSIFCVILARHAACAQSVKTLARPTSQQYAWQEQERIMFVVMDPATWEGREYDNHSVPLARINPVKLNTDQWCQAARSWGAKEILFVAKHTGGFCWWQTHTTDYGIRNTPWKNGKGDVLKELSASCKKYGLNLGIYVYPGDENWGAGVGSGGRTKDPARQAAYNKVYREQLKEVLTRYGKITEVWFDGSCVIDVSDILEKYAKDAVIFQGPMATIRWAGSESGKLSDPAWNTLKSSALRTGVATEAQGDPDGDAWAPLETNTTLYDHFWLWSPAGEKKIKSLDELMEDYYKSIGYGSVFLLNSTPDTSGLIPEADMQLYAAFGREIERRFDHPVAGIKNKKGMQTEIDLVHPAMINHVVIMEDYRQGARIRAYEVEGWTGDHWQRLSTGTAVGRKKIDVFDPVKISRLRLNVTRSAGTPLIRSLEVFNVSGPSGNAGTATKATAWTKCGAWDVGDFQKHIARITLDLSSYINTPGQYEIKFVPDPGNSKISISKLSLFFENEEAPGFLTRLDAHTFNINRTQQVTSESSSKIIVQITAENDGGCKGIIYIRPGFSH